MNYTISIGEQIFDIDIGNITTDGMAHVLVNGVPYEVKIENYANQTYQPTVQKPVSVPKPAMAPKPEPAMPKPGATPATQVSSSVSIRAPISGLILDINVKEGDVVQAGQTVATLEAMKMENKLQSSISGKVKQIFVQKGKEVSTGDIIMTLENN